MLQNFIHSPPLSFCRRLFHPFRVNMHTSTLRSLVSMNPVAPESNKLNASRTSVFCSSERSTLADAAMFDAATFFLAPPVMAIPNCYLRGMSWSATAILITLGLLVLPIHQAILWLNGRKLQESSEGLSLFNPQSAQGSSTHRRRYFRRELLSSSMLRD